MWNAIDTRAHTPAGFVHPAPPGAGTRLEAHLPLLPLGTNRPVDLSADIPAQL